MNAKRLFRVVLPAVALGLLGLALWLPHRHVQLYKVTVLPSLGRRLTLPGAINDRGQVAVRADAGVPGRYDLFVWDRENGIRDVGLSTYGRVDINHGGQIAGTTTDPNGSQRAFLWDPDDGIQMLGTLGGTESFATALNNRGQVVGYARRARDRPEAFIWDKAGGMRRLSPDMQQYGKATAINDAGQVLGEIETERGYLSPRRLPCYWDSTDPPATPTVRDLSPPDYPLAGCALNNNGYVLAATRRRREGMNWACLWHKDAGLKWLFPCGRFSDLVGFNDANQVLCSHYYVGPLQRLGRKYFPWYRVHYLWDPKRGKVILNDQIPRKLGKLMRVEAINNRGCIVGSILLERSGQLAGVLLEPIPERWEQ